MTLFRQREQLIQKLVRGELYILLKEIIVSLKLTVFEARESTIHPTVESDI